MGSAQPPPWTRAPCRGTSERLQACSPATEGTRGSQGHSHRWLHEASGLLTEPPLSTAPGCSPRAPCTGPLRPSPGTCHWFSTSGTSSFLCTSIMLRTSRVTASQRGTLPDWAHSGRLHRREEGHRRHTQGPGRHTCWPGVGVGGGHEQQAQVAHEPVPGSCTSPKHAGNLIVLFPSRTDPGTLLP